RVEAGWVHARGADRRDDIGPGLPAAEGVIEQVGAAGMEVAQGHAARHGLAGRALPRLSEFRALPAVIKLPFGLRIGREVDDQAGAAALVQVRIAGNAAVRLRLEFATGAPAGE